jgi:hypothetical protein
MHDPEMLVFYKTRPTVESTANALGIVAEALGVVLRNRVYTEQTDALTATAARMLAHIDAVHYHAQELLRLNNSPTEGQGSAVAVKF